MPTKTDGTPQRQRGGAKPRFTRHMANGLLDLRVFRDECEEAEARAESPGATAEERRRWTEYRDLMERAIDVRIGLMDADVASHEAAAVAACGAEACRFGLPCSDAACRLGSRANPSFGAVVAAARRTAA